MSPLCVCKNYVHHPLHLPTLITHSETEGWEVWGQRARTRVLTWTPPFTYSPLSFSYPTNPLSHHTWSSLYALPCWCAACCHFLQKTSCAAAADPECQKQSSEIQMTLPRGTPRQVALLLHLYCNCLYIYTSPPQSFSLYMTHTHTQNSIQMCSITARSFVYSK